VCENGRFEQRLAAFNVRSRNASYVRGGDEQCCGGQASLVMFWTAGVQRRVPLLLWWAALGRNGRERLELWTWRTAEAANLPVWAGGSGGVAILRYC